MLLSSVAERVYWQARYIERVENTARIILVNHNLLLDLPRNIALGWEPLVAITGSGELFREHHEEASERTVIRFLLSDTHNPNCIVCTLALARENLRTTRAIFPRATWEALNDLYNYAKEHKNTGLSRRGRFAYLTRLISSCQMIAGQLSATMSHDQTYDFARIGRHLERADMTTRVVDVRASNLLPTHTEELKPFDDIQWKSVLDSLAAYQMYRRYVHVRVRGTAVVRFLFQDPYFPRSVQHCLTQVEQCLRGLPANEAPLRTLGRAQRMIKEMDLGKVVGVGLNAFVDEIQLVLNELNDQFSSVYFQAREEPAEPESATA